MLNLLLADDDRDDCFFFKKALEEIPISTHLDIVRDGELLITYLSENSHRLPDIIFLDINMPRKNGLECLQEIKSNKKLKNIAVIVYSTSINDSVADEFYNNGAHYFVLKGDFLELKKLLHKILNLFSGKKTERPSRSEFVFGLEDN